MKKLRSSGACRGYALTAVVFLALQGLAGHSSAQGRGPLSDGYIIVTDTTRTGDSLRMINLQQVQVTSTRAGDKTPVAHSTIERQAIEKINNGVDLPFLLQSTPSVVATSDAGMGVGYTGVRIRGADASRINVTANGIPINDAESHSVFWVNMPDFVASVEDIQVQRGVGTSTNGAGAFGGSINMRTQALSPTPYAIVSGTYGSFNTHRESVNVGTGLLGGKWALNARLSNIGSDGYIDRASTKLKSYLLQGAFYSGNTTVKFINFAGKEETYHAWDGISRGQLHTDRRYNPCGEIWDFERNPDGTLVYDGDGNPKQYLRGYYGDQTDNYIQSNYHLLFSQKLSERLNLNVNLHYTDGDGYYEEYKNARKLVEFGLVPFVPADPAKEPYYNSGSGTVTKADLVRRKMMDNWFGGGVFSLDYNAPRLQASVGGAANRYDGDHWGRVIWIKNYTDPGFTQDHKYYQNTGTKDDINFYLKANWEAAAGLYLYGDLQYRHIGYKIEGTSDKWDSRPGRDQLQVLDVNEKFDFFNPKAGVTYKRGNWTGYASFAVAHKEPTRNNYTDAKLDETAAPPRRERLIDYEAGASFRNELFYAGVNLYYMDYKDQLVLTGETNEIGEPLADNVADSYRAGIEITAGVQPLSWLRWDVNATFSRNRIKGHRLYTLARLQRAHTTYLGSTDIAYSPEILVGSLLSFTYKGFNASFQSNFVGKQWITNSASKYTYDPADESPEKLSLPSYFVNNLRLDYTFRIKGFESITAGIAVNNLFDRKYCSNGYGWSEFADNGHGGMKRANTMMFFPQAGINILGSLTLRF